MLLQMIMGGKCWKLELDAKPSVSHYPKTLPGGSNGKASARNVGDQGLIPGLGRSPGEGNGNPLQYSCLENSMDGGAWWATVHGVSRSRTRLSEFTFTFKDTQYQNTDNQMGLVSFLRRLVLINKQE